MYATHCVFSSHICKCNILQSCRTTCCPVGGTLYKQKLLYGVIVKPVPHTVSHTGATSLRLIAGFDESQYHLLTDLFILIKVSDVNDDVRRAAVESIGFILFR